ncbi:hypothetical protein GCM10010195_39050 [Kitasatospora griseola]|nr:hypothetical protein GCM10010195_39050 [Kitasatospora griseola]
MADTPYAGIIRTGSGGQRPLDRGGVTAMPYGRSGALSAWLVQAPATFFGLQERQASLRAGERQGRGDRRPHRGTTDVHVSEA